MGQIVVNMNELAINKRCSKLKDWCSKMPKISYCHRCASFEIMTYTRHKDN